MKTYIISVHHDDETGKYWSESQIKSVPVTVNENETIHQAIALVLKDRDCCDVSYKGKPQGNIYRDDKDGNSKAVGYLYRTKHDIQNDDGKWATAYFTTWVTVHGELVETEMEHIEN